MAIREGLWDCAWCSRKRIPGGTLLCPGCHKKRGDEVQFYMDEAAAEVVDDAALKRARAGADWICEYCQALNPAGATACETCHADRSEKRRATSVQMDAPEALSPPPRPKGRGPWLLALGAVAVIGAALLLGRSSQKPMQLAEVSWEREIVVERLGTVSEAGWADSLPQGARVHQTERRFHHNNKIQTGIHEVHHTERVQTGTRHVRVGRRDLGNGFFEDVTRDEPIYGTREVSTSEPVYRDEPVYRNWCTYEVDRWSRDRVERAAGEDLNPRWPPVTLDRRDLREGGRSEAYRAVFRDDQGRPHEWKAPLKDWQSLEPGRRYQVRMRLGAVEGLAGP